jgi:hypothetical protein
MHCKVIACSMSFDAGLTPAERQKLDVLDEQQITFIQVAEKSTMTIV